MHPPPWNPEGHEERADREPITYTDMHKNHTPGFELKVLDSDEQ